MAGTARFDLPPTHGATARIRLIRARTAVAVLIVLTLCLLALSASSTSLAHADDGESTGCRFITVPTATPAFCDTFDEPSQSSSTRSGELDGTLWGVSRATSMSNPSQGMVYQWAGVTRDTCGTPESVLPDQDVAVCDGQDVEAVNDNGGQTVLAEYPRQPFDFAGRTGTVAFDVSDNTEGPHAAWPAFVISDQPVPAPYSLASGVADHARNSVGFTLGNSCGQYGCGGSNNPAGVADPGFSCVGVDSIYITQNYQLTQEPVNHDGCVLASRAVGSDNHFEVQVNAEGIRIFGSDPDDPAGTRLLADSSFTMPLSRGLIWLEDVHYNGDKFNDQQSDTFSWDNVAFDGPVLPRDLGFDVPDRTAPGRSAAENGQPTQELGFDIPGGESLNLTVPGVTGIPAASEALLTFNYWADNDQTITYSVNGDPPLEFPWPFGDTAAYVSETAAVPVPLDELQPGDNTVQMSTSDPSGVAIANVDLILQGAGGIPRESDSTGSTTTNATTTAATDANPPPASTSPTTTGAGSATPAATTSTMTATTPTSEPPTKSGTKLETARLCARARALRYIYGRFAADKIISLTVRERGTRTNPTYSIRLVYRNRHGRRGRLHRNFNGCTAIASSSTVR